MKKTKKILSLLLTVIFMMECSATVFAADSSVSYEGGAEKFVFLPGSEYTDTDLFDDFKNVMPGDVLREKITIRNNQENCDYVKIYIRAEVHDENENPMSESVASETDLVSMLDFLKQLSMTVWNGSEMIYQASPDELDGLQNGVLLGTFKYGEGTELTVELSVPMELENEYSNRIGEVDWVFVVEELNDPETPDTGDTSNILMWVIILVCTGGIVGFMTKRRKQF